MPFSKLEQLILDYAGKVIEVMGIGGFFVTLFFDHIARGNSFQVEWLQATGLMVFLAIAMFGVAVDGFLKEVKDMMKDYLSK